MEIIRTVEWMKQVSRSARAKGHLLGFVPTMGAIHEGHLSLVREAQKQCSPVVVSIFVNPTQFGPSEDLAKYPRPFEADRDALERLGVDYLFAPPVEEMYSKGLSTSVTVAGLGDRLEGRSRPGHFRGVATVVLKLFEIVQPHSAYFGRKDAQQQAVIRRMVKDLDLDVQIVTCPIIREQDGLALSSRNVYLKGEIRQAATALYLSLSAMRQQIEMGERNAVHLSNLLRDGIIGKPQITLEYAEIVDENTFEPVLTLRGVCYAVVAAKVGDTRLIDNAMIESTGDGLSVTV
jgi:pantoate--beta-alanine ligase